MLKGKHILVGVTGSIAAYKTAYLIRELIRLKAEVRVVMSKAACDFISPLTLSTLSKNPVAIEFVKNEESGEWENHVELGLWADLMIIAPLSANSLSKMVSGNSDNLLIATYLSAKCPVWIAPAMDLDMYKHFSTTENLEKLSAKDVHVLDSTEGELASGLDGKGRMEEPDQIAKAILDYFTTDSKLKGKNILITGGPTYEPIDPVRFIGNHSSGKTGVFLADACANRGANVTLVCGPTDLKPEHPHVKLIRIQQATEMLKAVEENWASSDIGIFSAAVSDYRPETPADRKIKKSNDELNIRLVKNPDILKWAGKNKKEAQFLVGFALETNNAEEHARKKLREKNTDMIVLNTLEDEGAGFGGETNKVYIVRKGNNLTKFELKEKSKVVEDILNEIEADLT